MSLRYRTSHKEAVGALADGLVIVLVVVGVSWGLLTLAEVLAAKVPEVGKVDVSALWKECNRKALQEVNR